MDSTALLQALKTGVFLSIARLTTPFYRLMFLASASRHGLLRRLALTPAPLESIAAEMAPDPTTHEALQAWLETGVTLGVLDHSIEGYALRSSLARKLSGLDFDPFAAFIEEVATLHHRLILDTPARLLEGKLWELDDQDGPLIARSSRILEPILRSLVRSRTPHTGPTRLLEVGCGSGTYIRTACEVNPELTALGIELQPDVAEQARSNLATWGLDTRVDIRSGDVRDLTPEPTFDLVTLFNNIYYFPVTERSSLFRHLRGFLKPGGRIVGATPCHGHGPTVAALNLWAASTRGCGRLPTREELSRHLLDAGFVQARVRALVPTTGFHSFEATRSDRRVSPRR